MRALLIVALSLPCPSPQPNVNMFITYLGTNSGCNAVNAQPCWPGEIVQFALVPYGYNFSCSAHQFNWTFGDGGAPANGQAVTHTFVALGSYDVSLTVTNFVHTVQLTSKVIVTSLPEPPRKTRRRSVRH